MIGIYKITSPTNRVYIGQSVDIEKRIKRYKGLHCKNQPILYNSFIKYGFENHIIEVKEECDITLLNIRERYWQDLYSVLDNNGLNCRLTGTKDKSGKNSQESIEKMRQGNLGKKISDEHKEKISIKLKGRKLSPEHIEKVRQSNTGRKRTSEHIEKVRQAKIGTKASDETKAKMRQAQLGRKHGEESLYKMSQSQLGKKISEEHKESIRKTLKGRKNTPEQMIKWKESMLKNKLIKNQLTFQI